MLANVPAGFTETVLAGSLTSPTTLDIAPDGRIWVAYQDGRIEVIEEGTPGTILAYQLDCDGSAEHGLQGIELDPDFATNGYIYVYYTANSPSPHNRLSRLTIDPTTQNTILAGSEVALLDLPNLSDYGNPPWHIGGAVHFGLDGTLYLQIGESQQAALSQDLESPLGKIFHLNVDGTPATNNPYYDPSDGISWRDYVWASGLRNPFAGDLHPTTGQYLVADVGQGSWEEINDATLPGRNFGWPATEGTFNPQTFPNFTQPLHAYSHAAGCAITGGAFNAGGFFEFPTQYDGMFFFSEFCGGEIRYIDPANPAVATVFATAADYPMNIEFGPDGSMYYISRGAGAGGAPGIGTGTVRKVAYVSNVPPAVVTSPTDQLVSVGYDATFTAAAAGSAPLTYQWQRSTGGAFTNVAGATSSTLVIPAAQLSSSGHRYRVVVTNAYGADTSNAATLTVTADTPPTPFISAPPSGSTYRAGDLITFSGGATDAQDGTLATSRLTWQVDFHHNVHSHPFIPPTSDIAGGQFVIPTVTETADDVYYRITLTATDSAGLTTTTFRDVIPLKSDFSIVTNLPDSDGDVAVDGHAVTAPYIVTGVENVQRTLEVPQFQTYDGGTVVFSQWLDGVTDRARTINTPQDDTAYVALYTTLADGGVYLSDLIPATTPANGWGPIELDTSNGEAAAGDGRPITLNGVVYPKGLGVHAASDITYNLDGDFRQFLSDIGVDDENAPGGTVVFRVLVDGIERFNSGVMDNSSPTQTVSVDLTGANQLRLIVETAGDGNGSDHADWATARVIPTSTPLVDINFQLAGAPVPAGYLPDTGQVFASSGNGWNYGWSSDHTDVSRDRNINADQRLDTLVHFHAGQTWEIELPNGVYEVSTSIGDAGFTSTYTLNVEGVNYWTNTTLAANQFASHTEIVSVTDGRLTLDMGSAADRSTRINYLRIAATAAQSTILPFSAADVDLNTRLDLNDMLAFAAGWGVNGSAFTLQQQVMHGDLNFDATTDIDDWNILNARWLQEGNAPVSLDALLNPIAGDYNRNGIITQLDYNVWKADYGSLTNLAADGNGDGRIDVADYTVWRDNLGAAAPLLNNLVLYVDPATGNGWLKNDSEELVQLIAYSVESTNAALRPSNGNWNSLDDQNFTGWEEANPTTSSLSELTSSGSLALAPLEVIPLGHIFTASTPHSGLSLEFATLGATGTTAGILVFSAISGPGAAALASTATSDEAAAESVPRLALSPEAPAGLKLTGRGLAPHTAFAVPVVDWAFVTPRGDSSAVETALGILRRRPRGSAAIDAAWAQFESVQLEWTSLSVHRGHASFRGTKI
jgi:glucose/arabinose dehydrogenase